MNIPALTQVKETCLYVSDLKKTREFYHEILGLEMIGMVEGRHVFFRVGPDVLLCFNPETTASETALAPHFGSGQLHFAMECKSEDYQPWKEYLLSQNIDIEREVHWGNGRYSFYFRDPDQHCLEIIMPGVWE